MNNVTSNHPLMWVNHLSERCPSLLGWRGGLDIYLGWSAQHFRSYAYLQENQERMALRSCQSSDFLMSCPKHSSEEGMDFLEKINSLSLSQLCVTKKLEWPKSEKMLCKKSPPSKNTPLNEGPERCMQPANTLSASFNQDSKIGSGMKLNQFSDEKPLELNFY